MPEVIEINSSDDEQQESQQQLAEESAGSEPGITDQKITNQLQAPNLILELRRKRIDDIFAEYARNHNWLLKLEEDKLMNPEQLQRWQSHLNSKKKPITIRLDELDDLRPHAETYTAEQIPAHLFESNTPYARYGSQSTAVASYQRRRPYRKRRAPKRRTAPKRSPTKIKTNAGRVQTRTSGSHSNRYQASGAQSSRPSTSGVSRVKVKIEKVRVKAEPR